jgi:hypothetical protein
MGADYTVGSLFVNWTNGGFRHVVLLRLWFRDGAAIVRCENSF